MPRRILALAVTVLLASCGNDDASSAQPPGADGGVQSEGGTTTSSQCSLDTAFDAPARLGGLATSIYEGGAVFSKDELEVFYEVYDDSKQAPKFQLYTARRNSIDDAFPKAAPFALNDANANNYGATLGDDDTTFVFASDRGGKIALYRATRASKTSAFGTPTEITGLGIAGDSAYLMPGNSGLWLTARDANGKLDIYYANASGSGFEAARRIDELDTDVTDTGPVPTTDGLALYFGSSRLDGTNGSKLDIYVAQRASATAKFDPPKLVPELNGTSDNWPSFLSLDRCRLYFTRDDGGGNYEIYVAKRAPKR